MNKQASDIDPQQPCILIVEDDVLSQKLLDYILRDDYKLCFATSIYEAKQQLEAHPVQLVLLDISLTGNENGLDLAVYIRQNKKSDSIPIIALSGHTSAKIKEICFQSGCNDYLIKPFQQMELLTMINHHLTN